MPTDTNLDKLLNNLVHGELQEQIKAYIMLSQIGEPAVLSLIDLLKNPENASIWSMIADTLNLIGDKRVVEPLIEKLAELNRFNERHDARRGIVMALGNLKDPRAVDVLLEALNHQVYEEGDDGKLYENYDEETVEAIEWALTAIGDPRALEPVFERILVDWYQDAELLIEWGEPAYKLVMNEIKTNEHNRRASAVSLLGDFGNLEAVEPLIELLLNTADENVKHSAAHSLGKLKDPRSFDALLKALNDAHPKMRRYAIDGLMGLKDQRALDSLNKTLLDEDASVRNAARFAINYIKENG